MVKAIMWLINGHYMFPEYLIASVGLGFVLRAWDLASLPTVVGYT